MFGSIDGFLSVWKEESARTVRVLGALTDASLDQQVAPGFRSLAELAWHAAGSIRSIVAHAGLSVPGPDDKRAPPQRADQLVAAYREAARALEETVRAEWNDDSLTVTDSVYDRTWARGYTLLILVLHQAHHRGQMTVLMRQAGLAVPGLYGPSKDAAEEI